MNVSEWLLAHGEAAQYAAFFGLGAALMLLERRAPARPRPAARQRWAVNAVLTALNILVLGALPVSFIGAAAWAREHAWGLLNLLAWPAAALAFATLALRGFISWITHLLMHEVPLFWRVHRVHHTDTELDVSSTVRFHPLESVIGSIIGVPIVLVLGLDPVALIAYELLDVSITLFSHANLQLPLQLERVLRYFIVTPDLHRVHHSTNPEETDSNFSAVFPIWDLLFGTFQTRPRAQLRSMPLGLAEVQDERSRRIPWLLALPVLRLSPAASASPRSSSASTAALAP
jgi:sterol desaturase/sphingolipid hydroxylase (fatty acid hydroxylase superfamily)